MRPKFIALAFFFALGAATLDAAEPAMLIGASVHVAQQKNTLAQVNAVASAMHLNAIRDEFYWSRVETSPGRFVVPDALREVSNLFVSFAKKGVRPLIVLDYGNALHTAEGMPTNDAARKAFADYAEFVAKTFADSHPIFEVWNEWNGGMGSIRRPKPKGSASDYSLVVREVVPRLRKVAPSALILVGATSGVDQKWTEEFLRLDDWTMADGFSVHPYTYRHHSDRSPEGAFVALDSLNAQLTSAAHARGKPPLPIYVTEVGWPTSSSDGGVSERLQADYALRFLLLARSRSYVKGVWWYELVDGGDDLGEAEHRFGMTRRDQSAKPVVADVARYVDCLKAGRYVPEPSEDKRVTRVHLDCGDGSSVLALWKGRDERKAVRLILDGRAAPLAEDGRSAKQLGRNDEAEVGESPLVLRFSTTSKAPRVSVAE